MVVKLTKNAANPAKKCDLTKQKLRKNGDIAGGYRSLMWQTECQQPSAIPSDMCMNREKGTISCFSSGLL